MQNSYPAQRLARTRLQPIGDIHVQVPSASKHELDIYLCQQAAVLFPVVPATWFPPSGAAHLRIQAWRQGKEIRSTETPTFQEWQFLQFRIISLRRSGISFHIFPTYHISGKAASILDLTSNAWIRTRFSTSSQSLNGFHDNRRNTMSCVESATH